MQQDTRDFLILFERIAKALEKLVERIDYFIKVVNNLSDKLP